MYKGREIADYLDDIRNAIVEVEEFTRGMTFEAFTADRKTVNAVIRSLEVLGEAIKGIPAAYRRKHPVGLVTIKGRSLAAPWKKITMELRMAA